MQWLQDPIEVNVDNLKNIKRGNQQALQEQKEGISERQN
jgi:hypothetical protein